MRWLQQQKDAAVNSLALDCAAQNGRIALCAYLHDEVGLAWSESVTCAGATGCQIEALRWLTERSVASTPSVVRKLVSL
jgi:hypothetical protein